MSFSGKFTPLQLNVISGYNQGTGIEINADARAYQGTWLSTSSYTQGTVTGSTVLRDVTTAMPAYYGSYPGITTIGQSTVPALGNSMPPTFVPTLSGQYLASWSATQNYTGDTGASYFRNGFVATIARQAYNELWGSTVNFRYNCIVKAFQQTDSWRGTPNQVIASFVNSKTTQTGNFSNINDFTTNDIAGVSLSFRLWGTDLLYLGRSLDLNNIHNFGLPSVLLRTLQANDAVTPAVRISLSFNDLSDREQQQLFIPTYTPTPAQEKKIYDSFKLIKGNDLYSILTGITYQMNCQTLYLNSLADLLNPIKMFPNSYGSLTVPQYRTDTVNSKTYYFIYSGNNTNTAVKTLAGVRDAYDKLVGILPEDIAIACAAFSVTMQQIKNIRNTDIRKLATSIVDLEVTNKDLPLVNTATGTPGNVAYADSMLESIGLGSGNGGAYRQVDFFGAASGFPYIDYYQQAINIIRQLPTANLASIYAQMLLPSPDIPNLIAQANAEIANIYNSNRQQCDSLNYYWNLLGTQMTIEQLALPTAIPDTTDIVTNSSPYDFSTFARSIETYAIDNSDGESGFVLDKFSDLTTITGQSMVASLREARNAKRLLEAGAPPDNDVSDVLDLCSASATATLNAGRISSVSMTAVGSGYSNANPPQIYVYPPGSGAVLTPVIAQDGSIRTLTIVKPGSGLTIAEINIDPPGACVPVLRGVASMNVKGKLGEVSPTDPTYPGTLLPDWNPPPPPVFPPTQPGDDASYTVAQAIDDVTKCNCDCWNI